ncbi:MAG: hypothetical protein ABSC21_09710 [Terriglobia bacterium]|jgi:hypothetical protein
MKSICSPPAAFCLLPTAVALLKTLPLSMTTDITNNEQLARPVNLWLTYRFRVVSTSYRGRNQ